MLSETEFGEISRTSIQTQTENLIRKPSENALTFSESINLKIKKINNELMHIEQHLNELKSHAHCFRRTDTRQQNEIFSSEISKCEHMKLELELKKKELSLHNEFINIFEEDKLMNTQHAKESVCEYMPEKEQNKLVMIAQQFSGALENITPELEKFQFRLQKLNEADADATQFSVYGQKQLTERQNSNCRKCYGEPYGGESVPCSKDTRKLSETDTNIAEHTNSHAKRTKHCLKHIYEKTKISMEIKQEKTKAERGLQMSLCKRDRNRFNYDKTKCMMKRTEEALSLYYQYFNQAEEALHLRQGTCQQFSEAIVRKGYEMLKEQHNRLQHHAIQVEKELAVDYEEVMAAHNVLEILEKHALNYSERQELLHSQELHPMDKMILLHELIEYVERDDQRLSYFLRETNESTKRMAAMVKAMDSIEGQARSLNHSDNESVKAELMKVVKQMQYAKCLDSCRALKDTEHLLYCMTEKITVKPSQLDQLRLKGEVESILKKCQEWSQREQILYEEQLEELEQIAASQYNMKEEQNVHTVKDVYQKVPDIPENVEIKKAVDVSVAEIKNDSGNEQKAVDPISDASGEALCDEARGLE